MPWYDRPSGLAPLPHITLKREISRPLPAAAESRMRCSWTASACSGRSHVMLRPCRTPLLGYLSCPTGDLQDLLVYDPAAMAWTDLSASASGTPPSSRQSHGFTSAGGKLYVHGGLGDSGEYQDRGAVPGLHCSMSCGAALVAASQLAGSKRRAQPSQLALMIFKVGMYSAWGIG